MAVDWNNPQDVKFLKTLKDQGVSAEEAFSRLDAVKASQALKSAAPVASTQQKPGFLDYLNPVGEYGPFSQKGFAGQAFLPAANLVSESTIKPVAKGAATVSVGALASGIKGAQGQKMDEPMNVPWLGNINPNANTPLQNVGLAGDVALGAANLLSPYKSMLAGGLRGAGQSAAKELEYNPNPTIGGVATQAGIGGALGAITSPQALEGAGNFLKGRATKLYNKVFKPKVNVHTGDFERTIIGYADDGSPIMGTPGEAAQEQGLWGGYQTMADKTAGNQSRVIQQRAVLYNQNSNAVIKAEDIKDSLDEIIQKGEITVPIGKQQQFDNFVKNIKADTRLADGKILTPQVASDLKTAINKEAGNAFGYESTATKEVDKALGRVLKESIEKQIPAVRSLNVQYGMNKELLPILNKGIKSGSYKPGWGTIMAGTTGGTAGAVLGGVPGAAIGGGVAGGIHLANKLLQTPLMRTLRGASMNSAGNVLQSAPIQALAGAGAFTQAFSEFSRGYRSIHPQATEDEIRTAYLNK